MAYPGYDLLARLMQRRMPGMTGLIAIGAHRAIPAAAAQRDALASALLAAAGAIAGPNPTRYPLGGLQRLGLGLGAGLHAASLLGRTPTPLVPIALAADEAMRRASQPRLTRRNRQRMRLMPASGRGRYAGHTKAHPKIGALAYPLSPATPLLPGAPALFAARGGRG